MTQACDQARRAIQERLDGAAEPQTASWLDAHLAECQLCRSEQAWLQATVKSLRELPPPEPDPDFVSSVLERCRRAQAGRERRLAWPAGVLVGLAATLLILAGRAVDLAAIGATASQLAQAAGTLFGPLVTVTSGLALSAWRALDWLVGSASTVLWAGISRVAPLYGTTLVVVVSLTLAFAVRHSPRLAPHWRNP